MNLVTITFEIDTDLYNGASEIFKQYGLTIEEAIILFIKETIARGTLPFPYTEEDIKKARIEIG